MSQIVQLKIEKLVYGGYGLAFRDGRAYFILNALPGEVIRAEILREKKNSSFGKSKEILEPSPLRQEADCPHFMFCGGCHLQHLKYEDQLSFKENILRETFKRLGHIDLDLIEVVRSEPWHYRTRAQFKVVCGERGAEVGFYAAQSHQIRAIDRCPLLAGRLNELLQQVQSEKTKFVDEGVSVQEFQLRTTRDETECAMDIRGHPPEFDFALQRNDLSTSGYLTHATAHGRFRVGSNSFFQVNRFLVDELIQKSLEGSRGKIAVDLFSGVGLFTVPLSFRFEHVIAVEENPSAVSDLHANLRMNEAQGVEVVGEKVSTLLRWHDDKWQSVDFVLMDPPRQGVEKVILERLIRQRVPRCVYVSCDPTSMARDLKLLLAGEYLLDKVQLFDFFPQTYHFETVAHLSRI